MAETFHAIEPVSRGERYPELKAFYESLYDARALEKWPMYYVSVDGCHPNRIGHDVLARALLEWFREAFARGGVPGDGR